MASVAPTDKKALIPNFLKLCLSGCQMKAFARFYGHNFKVALFIFV